MEPWHLFAPGAIYCGFVLGIFVLWLKERKKATKWTKEDDRALRAYCDQDD